MYEKVHGSGANQPDSFYRYSTDPAIANYTLSFTDVGQGRGDYLPDFNGANGKVFRYVAPVNGLPQGRYAPAQVLVSPKKQQIISTGISFTPDKNNTLQAELALSNYDPNTFSKKHDGDDKATAIKLEYANTAQLGRKESKLNTELHFEQVQAKFKPVERIRSVEFAREWGLPLLLMAADETICRLNTALSFNKEQRVTYQFTFYNRSDGYTGNQNVVAHTGNVKGWLVNNSILKTNFKSRGSNGTYFRPVIDVQKTLAKLAGYQFAFRYAAEKNLLQQNDTLSNNSFSFATYSVGLNTGEAYHNRYGLRFFTRTDHLPQGSGLKKMDKSYNINFEAELVKSQRHQLVLNTTYRYLKVIEPHFSSTGDDKTLLGRAAYNIAEWNGALTGNVLYELGTGQEQRRDFTYIEVPAGQGEYAWFDYNQDGVQQLSEFETAQFRDQARFLRVLLPTNEFVKAAYTTLNYHFTLSPQMAWKPENSKAWQKWLAKFSLQTSLQTHRRATADGNIQFNPLKWGLEDTSLIATSTTIGNTLSFNRQSSVWGFDLASFRNNAKALFTYGYESRQMGEWNLKGRLMLSKSINFDLVLRSGKNGLFTPSFENRNYDIRFAALEPRLTYLSGTVFRLQSSYRYDQKKNTPQYGGQRATIHSLNLESKYNVLQNSSVSGRIALSSISFNDRTASPVAYVMLDGLLPGKNLLWNLEFTKRLLNNVELNFQYDGRQPAQAKTVHTGRASLRALF